MNSYQAYRDSGVKWLGDVPNHWLVKRIRHSFKIRKRIANETGHQVLSITQQGIKVKDTESGGGQLAMDYSKYQFAYAGDFAMNHMDLLTGFVDISKYDGVISPDYRVFTLEDEESLARFYLYLLQMGYINKVFYAFGQGSSQLGRWRFPTQSFRNFHFPCPPLAEQRAIVSVLDEKTAQIDDLITMKQRQIELLKEYRAALINHAVTKGLDPNVPMRDSNIDWLGEIPAHWRIGGLTKYLEPVVDYRGKTPEKVDNGVFLVTAKNIKGGRIDYSLSSEYVREDQYDAIMSRGMPRIGDVLFTTEAPLGEVANVDREDIALAQRVVKFRGDVDKVQNFFLKYWIRSQSFQNDLQSHATGSTALGIKASKFVHLRIILPPIDEQLSIVQHLDSADKKIGTVLKRFNDQVLQLHKYRTALISEAVTGKIDFSEVPVE